MKKSWFSSELTAAALGAVTGVQSEEPTMATPAKPWPYKFKITFTHEISDATLRGVRNFCNTLIRQRQIRAQLAKGKRAP